MQINIRFFYYVGDEKLSFTGDYIYKFKHLVQICLLILDINETSSLYAFKDFHLTIRVFLRKGQEKKANLSSFLSLER